MTKTKEPEAEAEAPESYELEMAELTALGISCPRAVQLGGPGAVAAWVEQQYEGIQARKDADDAERVAEELAEADAEAAAEVAAEREQEAIAAGQHAIGRLGDVEARCDAIEARLVELEPAVSAVEPEATAEEAGTAEEAPVEAPKKGKGKGK